MKIQVDKRACSGQARCWATAPDVYELNDEGYNDSEDREVRSGELAEAARGALACPEQALFLVDGDGNVASERDIRGYAGLDTN